MNPLNQLGIQKQSKPNFAKSLFYFMRECHFNPLDEEYEIEGKKIIKKGISIPLFNALMTEIGEHYTVEAANMKKARMR